MSWVVVTPAAGTPVTLDEAKLHLRVDSDDEDGLVEALLQAACTHVENVCERALMLQTWAERLASFPEVIELRGGRVKAIQSVDYVDVVGGRHQLPETAYLADLALEPATLAPVGGARWPATRAQSSAVVVTYQVGYDSADAVPAPLKAAIKLVLGDLFENRSRQQGTELVDNPTVARLLFPYMRVRP